MRCPRLRSWERSGSMCARRRRRRIALATTERRVQQVRFVPGPYMVAFLARTSKNLGNPELRQRKEGRVSELRWKKYRVHTGGRSTQDEREGESIHISANGPPLTLAHFVLISFLSSYPLPSVSSKYPLTFLFSPTSLSGNRPNCSLIRSAPYSLGKNNLTPAATAASISIF